MYKAVIHNKTWTVDLEASSLDEKPYEAAFEVLDSKSFRLQYNNRTVIADLVKLDSVTKEVVLRIEGKKHYVKVKEPIDLFLESLGVKLPEHVKLNKLSSPMPGLVLKLLVKEGDEVKKGDSLLILEAMKMENVFKATDDVVIKEIHVTEKQAVEKGVELISFA